MFASRPAAAYLTKLCSNGVCPTSVGIDTFTTTSDGQSFRVINYLIIDNRIDYRV